MFQYKGHARYKYRAWHFFHFTKSGKRIFLQEKNMFRSVGLKCALGNPMFLNIVQNKNKKIDMFQVWVHINYINGSRYLKNGRSNIYTSHTYFFLIQKDIACKVLRIYFFLYFQCRGSSYKSTNKTCIRN